MTHNIIKSVAVLAIGTMLLMGCVKDNDGIVGEWQWTGTTMHHVNSYMGQDTTENWNFPIYKDLTFHEGGRLIFCNRASISRRTILSVPSINTTTA